MNKDILNLICKYLPADEILQLKCLCKFFYRSIKLIKLSIYFAITNKGNLLSDNNLMVLNLVHGELLYESLLRELSTCLDILPVIFYGQIKDRMTINKFYGEYSDDDYKFLHTSMIRHKKISFNDQIMECRLPDIQLHQDEINYILKEIRHIQRKCWYFSHYETTELIYDENILIFRCASGEILKETYKILLKLLDIFTKQKEQEKQLLN